MLAHQRSGSCLRERGLLAPVEVVSPDRPQVLSEEFEHERLFWGEIRTPLLLRKSLQYETLDTVEVVGFGELLQEPYNRVLIGEIIIFC